MKRTWLPFLLSLLLVPVATGTASAQTADEIAEKVVAALGGRDALNKLTSRRAVGAIVVTSPQGEVKGSFEIAAKAPNKSHMHIELDLAAIGGPGPLLIDQKFDGTTGNNVQTMAGQQGETPWTANQIQNAKNNLFPNPLLNYKARGVTLEALPKETLGGKAYLVLKVTPKEGSTLKIYIDPDTYLPGRTAFSVDMADVGEVQQTIELLDYRTVDGIKVAFKTVNTNPLQTATFTYTKVEHNVDLPDTRFGKAPAPAAR